MAQAYNTRDGDTVDSIAWRYYGAVNDDILHAVLEANPGLADRGPMLSRGVTVILPDIATPATTVKSVHLW